MRRLFLCLFFINSFCFADSIKSYMNITNNIAQMEIKADLQAQAWARSARHVLAVTCESIQETMLQANEMAKQQGNPLFCIPANTSFNAAQLHDLITETYKNISSQQSDKDRMTVSQVAFLGVNKRFPCQSNAQALKMAHLNAALKP